MDFDSSSAAGAGLAAAGRRRPVDTPRSCFRGSAALPVAAAAALFLGLAAAAVLFSLRLTSGRYVYPLDDTYITLAIARNVADTGTWGIRPGEFASSSSTPLFILALAAIFRAVPAREYVPLALDLALGVALLAIVASFLRSFGRGGWSILAALAAIVLAMPMPLMALSGMEHILHACLAILFLRVVLDSRRSNWVAPAALAALLTACRYESMALVGLGAVALWFRGNRRGAFGASIASALPVAVAGLVNVIHGWPFLPASMLVKVNSPGILDLFGRRALSQLVNTPALLSLLLLLTGCFLARTWRGWKAGREEVLLLLAGGTMLAHVTFANIGWLLRYEAYLVALAITAIWAAWPGSWRAALRNPAFAGAAALAAVLFAAPPAERAFDGLAMAVYAPKNIHDQQIRMSQFIGRYYDGAAVGLNDVGAVAFFTRARIVDYTGLGDLQALRMRRRGQPYYVNQAADVDALFRAKGVRIAALYDTWLTAIPPGWTEAGHWDTFNYKNLLGGSRVSFYALHPEDAAPLAARLRRFRTE